MVLPIYLYGQPVLRKPTEEIEKTPELAQFIADMYETLTQAEGCGLAAPQVGKPWRLFIVDGSELEEDYPECKGFKKTFINPELIEESEDTWMSLLAGYQRECDSPENHRAALFGREFRGA